MVAWSQPTHGADGEQVIELSELTARLCRDATVTPAMINALEVHFMLLPILKSWTMKTVAQRRKILLAAWPDMPEVHRPDNVVATEHATPGTIPDRFVWPFINQEDLTKPRTLLIFLNARGRKTPWGFSAIETQFSPALRIQQRILTFLFACARALLWDLTDDVLFKGPVQEEPSITQILEKKDAEHSSFTDILNLAPYHGWDSSNFSRLRGYIKGALSTQKNHIWVLREDPGYFADTVQEYLDHSLYEIFSACDFRPHNFTSLPEYKKSILVDFMDESLQCSTLGTTSARG
ncbi:hypothetical protein ST47_g9534 [Ascochyta rabiei]|uniref:Uncharacterized protein n=1 Tax=Didymella rabiei TaxID=5454 RepID=A0A162X3P2_DIDRA|nr:hypothetical protein ST47_g9534 [Ascochyta rabiei]